MRALRIPRQLDELRASRARRCSAKLRDGSRCSLPWAVAAATQPDARAGDANPLVCYLHARTSPPINVWTDDDERREVKYLRQQQLNHDRMMRGRT